MRPIERIDNFLSKVDWHKMCYRWKYQALPILFIGESDKDRFIKYWKENPDQRIGQLLINLRLIPDNFDIWNDEEADILKDQGLPPEEYLYWGSIYDKDMNRIPLKYRLIKDMDTDHIEKVLNLFTGENSKLTTNYITAFTNVLKSRNRNYSISDFGKYHSFYSMGKTI